MIRQEATELFSVAIISPSRVWKRGVKKEARDGGKKSPLRMCGGDKESWREGENIFSPSRGHARACKETRERRGGAK